MPTALMPVVESPRVGSREPVHRPGKIGLPASQKQVIMVRHQNISEKIDVKPRARLCQRLQKQNAIRIGAKNIPALIAAG